MPLIHIFINHASLCMKTILIPTDFSPAAMNAAEYAIDMAKAINADIFLLNVYQIPYTYGEIPVPIDSEVMIQDVTDELANIRDQLSKKTSGTIHIDAEVRSGTFFQILKEVCETIQPYAVIMGSQGSSAAQRLLFGSNSVYAVKHLQWPVIAVPLGATFAAIKKIGLACDFDKVMDTIPLDEIKTLINDFNATLYVLNSGKKDDFNPDLIFESHVLHGMLKPFKPNYFFITATDKDQGIVDFADNHLLDLLIVFPKKHDFVDRLIHTSHTKQLVLHCNVPVMSLHHAPA